ncbi:hypothetical protein [Marimonas arenosa]|uniref:Uncharacterized protein n=1 Tax=Marimonas arenosa TaxID=1795305 RepID=A0AAE4B6M2_9RHOB|nr:hypothetical protein [Marimonas arenosa]MDQ2092257.1 hypothetical protein [Marimonas arenosa]
MWVRLAVMVLALAVFNGGPTRADDLPATIADPSFLPDWMPEFPEEGEAKTGVSSSGCDAIVGRWQWANGNVFTFTTDQRWQRPDAPYQGNWACQVNSSGQNEVRITPDQGSWWTVVQIAPDGMRMSGIGDNGYPADAVRLPETDPELQRLVGTIVEGAFPLDGWQDMGGGLLEEPVWFSHYRRPDRAQLVLVQWMLPRRSGTQQATFQITDVLVTPALPKDSELAFYCREAQPNVTRKIIAVVRPDMKQEWWRDVRQAWAVDLGSGRIQTFAPQGIECVNEGWGN